MTLKMKATATNLALFLIMCVVLFTCSTTFLVTWAEHLPASEIELAMEMK